MSFGADWTCSCGWANLDIRKRCRSCGKDNPENPSLAKPASEPAGGDVVKLRAALQLAKDMFIANNLSLSLSHTFEVIDAALLSSAVPAGEVTRCLTTGNPVGTDTHQAGHPCRCANCAPAHPAPATGESALDREFGHLTADQFLNGPNLLKRAKAAVRAALSATATEGRKS